MAESDEWATVETVDDGVEMTYSRAGPPGVDQGVFEKIFMIISSVNPWYMVLAAISVYYLWQKLSPSLNVRNTSSYPTQNPEDILARQEAQEAARRKMQEAYDQKAREYMIKQKEKEELMKQEKLRNLEKYGSVLGRSPKTLTGNTNESVQDLPKKKMEKPKLRPEYNPLMGGGSSSCFRPTRRGGGSGGG